MTLGGRRSRDGILRISAVERSKPSIPVPRRIVIHEFLRQFSASARWTVRQFGTQGGMGMGATHRSRTAQGSGAAQDAHARAGARAAVLRSRVPVHVSRHRARRARVLARDLDGDVVGDAAAALPRPTIPRVRSACARRPSGAPRRCGCRWCGPTRFPRPVPAAMRAAAFAAEQGRGARLRARRRPARVLRRLRPRRPGDPRRGGGRRRHPARGLPARRGRPAARRRGRGGRAQAAGGGRRPAAGAAGRALAVLGRAARRRCRGVGAAVDPGARAPGV